MIKIGIDARLAKQGGKEAEKAVEGVGKEAKKAEKQLEMFDTAVDNAGKASKKAKKPVEDLGKETQKTGKLAKDAAKFVGKFFTAIAITGAVVQTISELRKFETGLAGVGKTANIEGAALESLGKQISGLGATVGGTPEKFLEIATAAGQLGVSGSANILAFTKTIAQLESASDLAGAGAATSLARILNATDEVASNVEVLGSVIVRLGNNVAATESEIATHATSVALATSVYNTSSTEAAAYGATLAAMGVRAELSGSAIARTYRTIDAASRSGGPALAQLQKLAGEDIAQVFSQNASQGMRQFIKGLSDLTKAGGDSTKALAGLGLNGEEILKVLPALAKASATLEKNFAMAADEQERNTALTEESGKSFDTLGGQIGRAGAGLSALQQSLSSANGPMQDLATLGGSVAFALAGVRTEGDNVSTTAEVMAGALKVAFLPATFAGVFFGVRALGTLVVTLRTALAAAGGLNAALIANPYAAVAAAVATLAVTFLSLSNHVDTSTRAVVKNHEALAQLQAVQRARAGGSSGVAGSEETIRDEIRALEEMQVLLASIAEGSKFKPLKGKELAGLLGVDMGELQRLAQEIFPTKGDKGGHAFQNVDLQFGLIHDRVEELKLSLVALKATSKNALSGAPDAVKELRASLEGTRETLLQLLTGETTEKAEKFKDILAKITTSGAEGGEADDLKKIALDIEFLNEVLEETTGRDDALKAVRKYTAALKEENDIRAEFKTTADIELELLRTGNDLRDKGVKNVDAIVASLRKELEMRQKLANAAPATDAVNGLILQLHATKLNTLESERFFKLQQHGQALHAQGITDMTDALRDYEEKLKDLQRAEYFEQIASGMSTSIGGAVRDVITGVEDMGDAFNKLLIQIGEQLMDALFVQPLIDELTTNLKNALPSIMPSPTIDSSTPQADAAAAAASLTTGASTASGTLRSGGVAAGAAILSAAKAAAAILSAAKAPVGSADGNVFSGGSIVPFAMGGVVNRTTFFPMANNQTGMMGEAGAEGILPLKRNKQGKLGVTTDGVGGGTTHNQYVNMTVHATDAGSFRRSRRQIMSDLKR